MDDTNSLIEQRRARRAASRAKGIDRLCMMLPGQESIRDVILFPPLKPK